MMASGNVSVKFEMSCCFYFIVTKLLASLFPRNCYTLFDFLGCRGDRSLLYTEFTLCQHQGVQLVGAQREKTASAKK